MNCKSLVILLACGAMARAAMGVDITLDLDGFANMSGGRVHGRSLTEPIVLPPEESQVALAGLEAGQTYQIDFLHNTGPGSSDFSITINDEGTGVARVTKGGGRHKMVTGFRPGDRILKLSTHDILYNANAGQTGKYFIAGLIKDHSLAADLGPQTWTVIPGTYHVDNLYNSGRGNEDYRFQVSSTGKVRPVQFQWSIDEDRVLDLYAGEYATFNKDEVHPRVATVQFRIEASSKINYHATHAASKPTQDGAVIVVDMPMTVGSGGLNIWSFGHNRIVASDFVQPNGKTWTGHETENDFHFVPWLRYDMARGFYFVTSDAPGQPAIIKTVSATAEGNYDGDGDALTVTITATILDPPEATTQPAEADEP